MSRFHIRSLDLNLLTVFAVLWDTRSVSRASERLSLTQPAVSHALRRLRDSLDDPLFVPGREGLTPTPRATELIHPVREALGTIERALEDRPAFVPSESHREFRIAAGDLVEFWILPALLRAISREAPHIVVHSMPLPDPVAAVAALEAGDVDVIVNGRTMTGPGIRCEPLADIRFATLIWKREGIRSKKFPLSLFIDRPHVVFQGRERPASAIDLALSAKGKKRKVGALVQNVLSMPAIAAETGYICNVSLEVAERFADVYELSVHRPPITPNPSQLYSATHARFDTDPALAWFLSKLRDAAASP